MCEREEDTVRRWVREFGPGLLAVTRSFAEGPDEAEDLLQEVWMVALRKFGSRPPDAAVRYWLHSITLKICLGRTRTRRRLKNLLDRWPLDVPRPGGQVNPPSLERHFRLRAVWEKIGDLPPLERDVILLRVVEGKSVEEAASILGRAEGTVKASQHRALKKLKELRWLWRGDVEKGRAGRGESAD